MNYILKNTKKNIYINAGHYDKKETIYKDDPGAIFNEHIEGDENIKIRDLLIPKLNKAGFNVYIVPDELNLKESIAWVNNIAKELNDGLALSIHFNYLSDTSQRGTEAFYGTSETTKQICETLCVKVSKALNTKNRHAKKDTLSNVGELGWIRKTNCWSVLLEVCFLTNVEDMFALKNNNGYEKVTDSITEALCEVYGIITSDSDIITILTNQIKQLTILINNLLKQISLLK